MWSVKAPHEKAWTEEKISPLSVLYYYDFSLTFVSNVGFQKTLFHNIGHRNDRLFYIAVPTNDKIIDALEEGRLSIFGSLNRDTVRIVETSLDLCVCRYWETLFNEVPVSILPKRGNGLYSIYKTCPDTIEQATGFFSMRFIGDDLKNTGAPFSLVKKVIDHGYDAVRSLLSPRFVLGARPSTFDFNVSFVSASILLKVELPVMDPEKLGRRAQFSLEEIRSAFSQKRDEALEILNEINHSVGKDTARDFITKNESIVGDLISIMPTEDGRISKVEFSGSSGSTTRLVTIGMREGAAIASMYNSRYEQAISDEGIIEIVNSSSKYFVYNSARGKQVACRIPYEIFDKLEKSERFRSGTGVKVKGRLEPRRYRDEITCEEMPELIEVSNTKNH